MEPGVYLDIKNEDYHGGAGVSKSGLDLISRSPLHFMAARQAANDSPPTAAQAIGSAFHEMLLEPALFVQNYTTALRMSDVPEAIDDRQELVNMVQELNATRLPKLSTTGKKSELIDRINAEVAAGNSHLVVTDEQLQSASGDELKAMLIAENDLRPGLLPVSGSRHELAELLRANGKPVTLWSDVMAAWIQNNGHRKILSPEQFDQLNAMRDSVMAHPAAAALLSAPGVAEASVYWTDPVTGELCRCRPDFWRNDDIIVDIKTTEDASPEGFAKSISNWRYHVQAPYYMDGVELATGRKQKAFVFLAVEKKAPYAVGVYTLDSESIMLGRAEYRRDLNLYAECKAKNLWPGYGETIQKIGVPQWALMRNAALLDKSAA